MYRLCYRLRKLGVEVPHRMRRIEVQDEEEIKPVKVSAVVYSLISEYNFSVQFRILDAEGTRPPTVRERGRAVPV